MKVHFIAIGGSVMHQLAIALHRKEYQVSGSDDNLFDPAWSNLLKAGILPPSLGWHHAKVSSDLDAVILGMHAKHDNPELLQAKDLGLKIYPFPEYIYEESRHKTRVVVGGTHDKAITTAIVMHVLRQANKDFDYLVGGPVQGFDQSVRITHAPIMVCEGEEYPASALEKRAKFHFLLPHIAILTGIDWHHSNIFPTFELYLEQFSIFIKNIQAGGVLIYNEKDEALTKLVNQQKRSDCRYQPYQPVPGEALLNRQAAWYACRELGITEAGFNNAIASFNRMDKGFSI